MLKRIVPILAILFVLPTMAHAWYITASTNPTSGRGTITPSGTVYMSSIAATQDFVVAPAAGYTVSRVTLDGVNISPKAGTTDTYTVGYKAGANYRYIVAYFIAAPGFTITVNLGANGSYRTNPTGQSLTNIPAGSSRTLVFTPYNGYQVDTITAPGAVITDANDGAGSKNVAYTNIQANQTVSASFKLTPVVIANAGPDLTTQGNSAEFALTLDGSQSSSNMGAISYSWTSSGPGAGIFSNPAAQKPTFYSITPGAYTVTLTITSGGIVSAPDTAVITVVSRTVYQEQICTQCHAARNPTVVTTYDASPHKAAASMVVVCQTCHDPANTGHYTIANPLNACAACHISVTPQVVTDYQGSPHAAASVTCTNCHTDHSVLANRSICQSCHSTVTPKIVSDYLGSLHATNATRVVDCYGCHATHAARTTFTTCLTCHAQFPANLSWHASISLNYCQNCHNPHYPENISIGYPHFSNYTTAQYFTPNISCEGCHIDTQNRFNVYSANRQWAKSGHADPLSPAYRGAGPYTTDNLALFDFKFLGTPLPAKPATTAANDCVRCHTTTGFVNYVNSNFSDIHAWGTAGDRTREMVACPACHTPTPFAADFSRRSIGIETDPVFNPGVYTVVAWYGYSSATTKKIIRAKNYLNPDFGDMIDSNICVACHSGKFAGEMLKLSGNCSTKPSVSCRAGATGTFWDNVDFMDPHGMASANIMIPDGLAAGYEFRSSATTTYHSNIAQDEARGPCVGCHMSAPQKHLFQPLSSSSSGAITAIRTSRCAECHGANGISFQIDSPTILETKKEGYQAALAVIAAQLAAKGIYFNAAKPPYFFTTSDLAAQSSLTRVVNWNYSATFQGANLMGAAFNLRLLKSDAGWVHNGSYSKRLLYDTIDYLDDGNPNNNTVLVAIQNLNIDQDTKDRAAAYIGIRP